MRTRDKNAIINIVQQAGFTLIEVMITVVIVGILAAVAYPMYTDHVTATRRGDGMAGALRVAADLEKFKGNCGQYTSNITGGVPTQPTCSGMGLVGGNISNGTHYLMTIVLDLDAVTGAAIGHTITATPQGIQATRDAACGNLTYNHRGAKGVSGSKPVNSCWKN